MQLLLRKTTVRTAKWKSSKLSNDYPRKILAVGDAALHVPMRQEMETDKTPFLFLAPTPGRLLVLSEKVLHGKGILLPFPKHFCMEK